MISRDITVEFSKVLFIDRKARVIAATSSAVKFKNGAIRWVTSTKKPNRYLYTINITNPLQSDGGVDLHPGQPYCLAVIS